jgi:hypothetical protein
MFELPQDRRENWANVRMQNLLATDTCPKCKKHRNAHDNDACTMRYTLETLTFEEVQYAVHG